MKKLIILAGLLGFIPRGDALELNEEAPKIILTSDTEAISLGLPGLKAWNRVNCSIYNPFIYRDIVVTEIGWAWHFLAGNGQRVKDAHMEKCKGKQCIIKPEQYRDLGDHQLQRWPVMEELLYLECSMKIKIRKPKRRLRGQ